MKAALVIIGIILLCIGPALFFVGYSSVHPTVVRSKSELASAVLALATLRQRNAPPMVISRAQSKVDDASSSLRICKKNLLLYYGPAAGALLVGLGVLIIGLTRKKKAA